MRIPCDVETKYQRGPYPALLIAVDGDYCHVVDGKGRIQRVQTRFVTVRVGQCFSNSLTVAVKL